MSEYTPEQDRAKKKYRGARVKQTGGTSELLRRMVSIAMFSALAYICVFVLRFKVGFLTFDAKDAIMTVGALYFGPTAGITMNAIVALLEFITVSDTGVYGLLMNFISSATFTFVASLLYRRFRTLGGAAISLFCAALSMTGMMMLANLLITPFYMGVSRAEVIALIPTLLLPFNFTKAVLNASLVLLLYKPMTLALVRTGLVKRKRAVPHSSRKMLVISAIALLLAAACILVYLFVLRGSFEWVKK